MKNDLQRESLRQLLLAQKAQLIEKIKQARGGMRSRAEAASAQLAATEQSHAQNMTERDTSFAIQEHDMAELEALEQAIARMAKGSYGLCQRCEVEIPITRLLTLPSAMHCITCQTALEQLDGPDAALHA